MNTIKQVRVPLRVVGPAVRQPGRYLAVWEWRGGAYLPGRYGACEVGDNWEQALARCDFGTTPVLTVENALLRVAVYASDDLDLVEYPEYVVTVALAGEREGAWPRAIYASDWPALVDLLRGELGGLARALALFGGLSPASRVA